MRATLVVESETVVRKALTQFMQQRISIAIGYRLAKL